MKTGGCNENMFNHSNSFARKGGALVLSGHEARRALTQAAQPNLSACNLMETIVQTKLYQFAENLWVVCTKKIRLFFISISFFVPESDAHNPMKVVSRSVITAWWMMGVRYIPLPQGGQVSMKVEKGAA
jgi:hypothetical protein